GEGACGEGACGEGACGEGACAAAERASPPDVNMVVAKNPAKPRRVSMGLPLPRVRCGAKARAYPRVSICSGEATPDCPVRQPPTAPRVAPRRPSFPGMPPASLCFFA